MNIILISIFGVLGVLTRYSADVYWEDKNYIFPYATLLVNILGCFVAGFIYTLLSKKLIMSEQMARAIIIGFCGGLTTFSGYCLQSLNLMQNGDILKAFTFIVISIALGLATILLGIKSATYIA
tara:strand:+ start:469 stop:840 length:372 start_codon:yes stop_codon:yes gene_type:complete